MLSVVTTAFAFWACASVTEAAEAGTASSANAIASVTIVAMIRVVNTLRFDIKIILLFIIYNLSAKAGNNRSSEAVPLVQIIGSAAVLPAAEKRPLHPSCLIFTKHSILFCILQVFLPFFVEIAQFSQILFGR
jgi:hypothetical protein